MFRCKLSLLAVCLSGACFFLASCATVGTAVSGYAVGESEPGWLRNGVHQRYNKQEYLTAVGHGGSMQAAEMDALRALVSIFGVSVQVDTRMAETFRGIEGGVGSHNVDYGSEITLGAGMDNLIGAEIGDRWDSRRGNFSALAVLNKARAEQTYTDLIRANQTAITNLTNLPAGEKNSLAGFSRFQLAAVVADINTNYATVVTEVSGSRPQGLRSGDDYRREAQEIAAAIPVVIRITNDSNQRLQGAFAKVFTELGFRTGGANSRYALVVNVSLRPSEQQTANVVFSQMELSANLVDNNSRAVLLPFTFTLREGHANQAGADNRAFIVAEQKIASEYPSILSEYLSQLSTRK